MWFYFFKHSAAENPYFQALVYFCSNAFYYIFLVNLKCSRCLQKKLIQTDRSIFSTCKNNFCLVIFAVCLSLLCLRYIYSHRCVRQVVKLEPSISWCGAKSLVTIVLGFARGPRTATPLSTPLSVVAACVYMHTRLAPHQNVREWKKVAVNAKNARLDTPLVCCAGCANPPLRSLLCRQPAERTPSLLLHLAEGAETR